jgi:spore germination protein KA
MGLVSKLFAKPKKKKKKNQPATKDTSGQASDISSRFLNNDLSKNLQTILNTTGNSADIIIRQIDLADEPPIKAALVMVDGLIDDKTVNESIIHTLLNDYSLQEAVSIEKSFDYLEKKLLPITNVTSVYDWNDLFGKLLSGETIIFIDGIEKALSTSTRGGEKRAVTESQNEVSLRGPKEAFTESMRTNTSLIRSRIKNPNLWIESFQIGKVTKTDINVMYMKGIANDKIVKEVRRRLKRIEIDQIPDSGFIEQLIEEKTYTIFPTVYHTERPDIVAANLMEGKIAIIVNGSPFVLTVPALFIEFFQAADDYYARFDISTGLRFLRVLIFFISIVGPATYVAVTTYHQEMIPTLLIIAIAAQREAVPFPAYVEALLMETTFEILREAGVRLPKAVGQAVSIVGALVIGQAAIQAGIVSPAMVIVVSITAIANFATPSFSMAISTRVIRFGLMTLAAVMGFYGIITGLMMMTLHLCSLRSFGVPYMEPLAPLMIKNMGDTIIRIPLWKMKSRPKLISQKNIIRQGDNQQPRPPEDNGS